MPYECVSIKWLDQNTAIRRSHEVDLKCQILKTGDIPFDKDGDIIKGVAILLTGWADCEHHLIEDAAILLKKMCDEKCGRHSI